MLNLQSALMKVSSLEMFISGVGSGRPPHVMFFLPALEGAFPPDLLATALAAGAGDDFPDEEAPPPPKSASRLEGGIFDPGQLNEGIALMALCD